VPSKIKTTALPMTSTSSLRLMSRSQAWERSTICHLSYNVSR
jgi:hypothetical protein